MVCLRALCIAIDESEVNLSSANRGESVKAFVACAGYYYVSPLGTVSFGNSRQTSKSRERCGQVVSGVQVKLNLGALVGYPIAAVSREVI